MNKYCFQVRQNGKYRNSGTVSGESMEDAARHVLKMCEIESFETARGVRADGTPWRIVETRIAGKRVFASISIHPEYILDDSDIKGAACTTTQKNPCG